MLIICNYCGSKFIKLFIKSFVSSVTSSAHIGAECADCGKWAKWLSKEEKQDLDLTKIEERV